MDQQEAQEIARLLNIIGGSIGGLCGVFGALVGYLAPRGKGRTFILAGLGIFIAVGAGSLVTGAVLAIRGVPFVVYWPALLMGFILLTVLGALAPVILKRYREADARRFEAAALRQS
jgi:hypothetical protein